MSYIRAEEVLPKELIETIQHYVSGAAVYIPSAEKKDWGSGTDTKAVLADRNRRICREYAEGASVKELSVRYALAEKTIQKILRRQRTAVDEKD